MSAETPLRVTEVTLRTDGEVIERPSVEQLTEAVKLLEKMRDTRKASQELLRDPDTTDGVGEESDDASFKEPDAAALKAALDDIETRAGLSEQEYAEYNLKNVDVEFAVFKKRLSEAPIEKRVRIVEAHQRGDNLVLFCKRDSGEFGLMNPRQVNKELVNREFNAWGAQHNKRDPEESQVNILRARGMEPATKNDALHVTACDSDSCEGVYWLTLAPRENMTPEGLDKVQSAADFCRGDGGTYVCGSFADRRGSFRGGLGVLWV